MDQQQSFINLLTGQAVEPAEWQLALAVGDYYLNDRPVVAINGGMFLDDVPNIYGEIVSSEGCRPGMFITRGYSQWCPEGELGLFHICEATRQLTADEFEAARKEGWT